MSRSIFLVTGSKHGVGRSILSMALLNHLKQAGQKPFFIETDTAASAVWWAYENAVQGRAVSTDASDGWSTVKQLCDSAATATVINARMKNEADVRQLADTVKQILGNQRRKLIVFCVVDREWDSLTLLDTLAEALLEHHNVQIHIVRNIFWGAETEFSAYNKSNLKKQVEYTGGKSLNLPDVANRVVVAMKEDRTSIRAAIRELPFGSRVELLRWQGECRQMLSEAIR